MKENKKWNPQSNVLYIMEWWNGHRAVVARDISVMKIADDLNASKDGDHVKQALQNSLKLPVVHL